MLRLAIACLLLLSGSSARADVFVIAPPYYVGTDGERVSDAIAHAIQDDLATQHKVVGPGEAAALVRKEERVWCREGQCAERYRQAAGAAAAILIRVSRVGEGQGLATSFQIGIQPSPGVEYTRGALLTDGPLAEISVRALREAFRDYRQGPGPWLEITGAPEGAAVIIDDRGVGTSPLTIAVPSGSHRVRLEARTFAPMTKIVTLDSPTDRKALDFRLEPEGIALPVAEKGAPDRPRATEAGKGGASVWADAKFYIGAAGLVGGASLVGLGVASKVHSGECAERDPLGPCSQVRTFGPGSKTMLGLGVPLLAVGIALLTTSVVRGVRDPKDWKATVGVGPGVFGVAVGRAL